MSMFRRAYFSPCWKWRYSLFRRWGDGPQLCMVMLNPSIADDTRDDATTSFCMGWAKRHRFGSYEAVNLFAIVGTDPRCLHTAADPVGTENDEWIVAAVKMADSVIVAWGATPYTNRRSIVSGRPWRVLQLLRGHDLCCFGKTRNGWPRFPRALPRDVLAEHYLPVGYPDRAAEGAKHE